MACRSPAPARGAPASLLRPAVAGLTPDGLVAMREVQVACMASAGTGGGTLFYRSRGAGEGEAGLGVAVEHAVEGGGAGMFRRSDPARAGRDRARPDGEQRADGERRCFRPPGAVRQDRPSTAALAAWAAVRRLANRGRYAADNG